MAVSILAGAVVTALCGLLIALLVFKAAVYDFVIVKMTEKWYLDVLNEVPNGTRLIDVGIGTASALARNADVVKRKSIVVAGFDYEAQYVTKARAVLCDAGLQELCHVCQADVFSLDLARDIFGRAKAGKNGFADAAYFSGSLMLMPEPHKALQAVAALLKPGGKIYVTQTLQNRPSPLMERVKPLLKFVTSIDFGSLVYYKDMQGIVEEAGFKIVVDRAIRGSINTAAQTARMLVLERA
jgi:ubiquinone/menaquinone biosynthesis C-methylase UbiE